jgi:hypothetical protein
MSRFDDLKATVETAVEQCNKFFLHGYDNFYGYFGFCRYYPHASEMILVFFVPIGLCLLLKEIVCFALKFVEKLIKLIYHFKNEKAKAAVEMQRILKNDP